MENDLINGRLQVLNPEYRAFIESGFIEEAVETLLETIGLTGRNREIFQNSFYLYTLFFLDETTLATFMSNNCDLSLEDALEITYAFTASLPEGLNEMIKSEYDRINSIQKSTDLISDIAETENALRSIEGLRTMAGDASVVAQAPVNTYQSSQAEILTRPDTQSPPAPTVLPSPPPTDTTPRWGSEN